jgi:hypothetical protein
MMWQRTYSQSEGIVTLHEDLQTLILKFNRIRYVLFLYGDASFAQKYDEQLKKSFQLKAFIVEYL